ncbi:MAG: hypothetical protein HOM21_14935, partial [Halobacteriovoraceae bacterium]|nr:hypothetical protein [Halobacteriovoraceae bacterium]
PFYIFKKWEKGEIQGLSDRHDHGDDTKTLTNYGVFVKGSQSRVITRHISRSTSFYGATYTTTKADKVLESGYGARFEMSYENDHTSAYKLKRYLKGLSKSTGLRSLVKVGLPKIKKFGYAKVKFSAEINDRGVRSLLTGSRSLPLEGIVGKAITEYFKAGDVDELCNSSSNEESTSLSSCESRFKKSSMKAVAKMKAYLAAMQVSEIKAVDFAKNFAKFGKASLKNQFTFKGLLNYLKGKGLALKYVVEGEKIHQYKKLVR